MSANTIRTVLGKLQDDPDHEEAWAELKDALGYVSDDERAAPRDSGDRMELFELLQAARRAHEGRREYDAVAELLRIETSIARDSAVEVSRVAELARLYEEELLDDVRAVATWKRLLELEPQNQAAADAIERANAKREKWRELVMRFVDEAKATQDAAFKSSLLVSAAEVAFRFGRLEAANDDAEASENKKPAGKKKKGKATKGETLVALTEEIVSGLQEALELDPKNRRATALLERVFREDGRWEELSTVLESYALESPVREEKIATLVRLARVEKKKLGRQGEAVRVYESVLDLAPGHSEATSALVDHFTEKEDWDHLVALYEQQLEASSGRSAQEAGAIMQIAMVHWRMRARPEIAEPYFERLRKIDPAHPGMLSFFREFLTERRENARLVTVLQEAQRVLPEGEARTKLSHEIAQLAEEGANAQKAIEQWRALLRQDPSHKEAREALKRLYRQSAGWNALADLLRGELERTKPDDKDARLPVLREIASVYRDYLKSDSALVTVLTQITQLAPDDVDAVRELVRVYDVLGRHRDLLAIQTRLAELEPELANRAEIYRQVARRWLEQFTNVQNAIDAYEKLREAKPDDREALDKLKELYGKRRAYRPLYDLYAAEAELMEAGPRRREMWLEMAKLAAERLDKGVDAVRLYKQVLAEEPSEVAALDALEKQAERDKDFTTVAEVLERRADHAPDEAQKLVVLQKLGTVYSERLRDPEGAKRAWVRVLAMAPGHAKALRVLRESYLALADYDGLTELYAQGGDWEGLVEVLSTAADRATEPDQKVALSYRAAAVFTDRLGAPERAFRAYERVLAVDPNDPRAARALVPLYEKEEKWSRLPALYEVLLGHAENSDEKIAILERLAKIAGSHLADKAGAFRYAKTAYELEPTRAKAVETFELQARASGEWQAFVTTLSARASSAVDEERRQLTNKIAEVSATELGKLDEAVATYKALIEADPADERAVITLDRLLRQNDLRDDLRWLLRLRISRANTSAKLELLGEWAVLEDEAFGAQNEAILRYREMLELVPHHGPALRALARLLRASGDAAGAAEILERDRDLREGADRAGREIELARVYLSELKKPMDALAAVRRVFDVQPNDPDGIRVTEELLNVAETRAQAAVILEAAYGATGQLAKQGDVLAVLIATAVSKNDRLPLYERLADVHEKLGNREAAFDAVTQAVTEFPAELPLWDRLNGLANKTQRMGEFVDALALAVPIGQPSGLPGPVARDLAERIATLCEESLGDIDRARPYWERIVDEEPGNERAFTHLKQILTTRERWEDLEAHYEKGVAATEDVARKTELLGEAAIVAEEITNDPLRAIGYYERIVVLDATHEGAVLALDKLYVQESRWTSLAELLQKRIQTADVEAASVLKVRLGKVFFDRLSDPKSALAYLEEVLVADANELEARDLVERCLSVPELRARAAAVLEGVYGQRDESRDLVRVLEVRLEFTTDETEQKELLRRVAELRDEKLSDDPGAFEAYARFLPLAPEDADARARLLEIARRRGLQGRAAEVLRSSAVRAPAPQPRADILADVARIHESTGEALAAEQTWREVLDLDPTDPILALPAAKALERMYVAAGKHAELAAVLRTQVELEDDATVRRELIGRLGELCESVLGDVPGAILAWKSRVADDPGDEQALSALDRLYERSGAYRELVEVLRAREGLVADAAQRKEIILRVATALADRLGDSDEAILAYRSVVDDFGPEASTLEALAKLYELKERWRDLAETLEAELGVVEAEEARVALFARLGTVQRDRLGETQAALDAFRQALALDMFHTGSREALEKLLDDPDARREAAELLRPLYESDGEKSRLLRVLEIEIEYAEATSDKLNSLAQAVTVAEGALNDPARAFAFASVGLKEAASTDEFSAWVERVERLSLATGSFKEHVALLAAVAPDVLDEEVQLGVILRVAELARNRLADAELAKTYYQKALEIRADDKRALGALEELYGESNEAAKLLDILRRRADSTEDPAEKKAILYKHARLSDSALGDPDGAISVYEEILDLTFEAEAIGVLERLYATRERWVDLVALHERELAAATTGQPRRAALSFALGQVFEKHTGDIDRAFDAYESALQLVPQHEPTVAALEAIMQARTHAERASAILEQVYLSLADWPKVMGTLEARLDVSQDPDEKRTLLRRLSKLHEEQAEDYKASLEVMAKLLAEDITDETTWGELERLARVANSEGRLAEIYAAELAKLSSDEPATAKLAERTGEILEAQGQFDRALEFYRRAYAFSPEESASAFGAIDRLLIKLSKSDERVKLYRESLDYRHEPEARVATLHVVARAEEEELKNDAAAIATHREVLDVDERDLVSQLALTRLFERQSLWKDLAELYRRRAESSEIPVEEAGFRVLLGTVLEKKLEDVSTAIDEYQAVIDLNVPGASRSEAVKALEALITHETQRARVVELLRPIYEAEDDWQRLIVINGERFSLAQDDGERVAILRETARLWEERGKHPGQAFDALRAAFELDPQDGSTREELDRLALATSRWDDLAETYETGVEKLDGVAKKELLEALARLHDKKRDDPRKSLAAWERAFKADESDHVPLDEMDQLATLLSDWVTLVRVLAKRAELTPSDEDRARYWRRIGESRRDMLDDVAGAIDAYERALELEPESAYTLDNLIALYEAKNDAARLVELYRRRIELCTEDDEGLRFQLILDTAKRYEEGLSDRREAIVFLEQARALRPRDGHVIAELGRLFEAEQLWQDLADNLRQRVELADASDAKHVLQKRLGGLLAKELDEPSGALDAYRTVLASGFDEEAFVAVRALGEAREELRLEVAAVLEPVLRSASKFGDLVDAFELRLRAQSDAQERSATLRDLAIVAESELGDVGRAELALLRALAETPESASLHEEVARVAGRVGKAGFERYADALSERATSVFDTTVTADLYARLGRISATELGDLKRAAGAYQKAAEQSGDTEETLTSLEEVLGKLGDSTALADVLERRISLVVDASQAADLLHRLARLQSEGLGSKGQALVTLRQALERVPDHVASREALEGLLDDASLFDEAFETLEVVYRSLGHGDKLAALYERRVGRAETAEERVRARLELAKVVEVESHDAVKAQRVVEAALADDVHDADVLVELERLAEHNRDFPGAAKALAAALEAGAGDETSLATLWVRLAEWHETRLEDRAGAEAAYRKAQALDTQNLDIVRAIEALLRAPGRERDLAGVLRTRAKLEVGLDEKRSLFREAKALADSPLADSALAEAVLRDLLAEDEADEWALAELTKLRDAAGDFVEVTALLAKRAEAAADGEAILRLKHEAANVFVEKLAQPESAIALYEDILEQEPTDARAASQLRGLYEATGRDAELGKLMGRLIDVADTVSARAALRIDLARLQVERFKRSDDAVDTLRAVLDEDPDHADAVVRLSEILEQTGQDAELADFLEKQTERARDRGDTQAELTLEVRLGEVQEGRLKDAKAALKTYESVLSRDPGHRRALEAVARLSEARDAWDRTAEVLAKLLETAAPEDTVSLAVRLASAREKVGDSAGVEAALLKALEVDEREANVRDRLRALYEKVRKWSELALMLVSDADHVAAEHPEETKAALAAADLASAAGPAKAGTTVPPPAAVTAPVAAQVKLLRRAAEIHLTERSAPVEAVTLLERATKLVPQDRELLLLLCDVYTQSGRERDATAVLERIIGSFGGKRTKELGVYHHRLGRALAKLDEKAQALAQLDLAFKIDPGSIEVLKDLGVLALDTNDLERAQKTFRALLLQKLDPSAGITKGEVFYYLGEVSLKQGDKSKAQQMFERAIENEPSLDKAKAKLAELKG